MHGTADSPSHGARAFVRRGLRRAWRTIRPPAPETVSWTQRAWSIGIYRGPSPLELRPGLWAGNPVLTPADVSDMHADLIADPFMLAAGGRWYMFFEALDWERNRGTLGVASSDDLASWRYERIVLQEPFHLSYPYVFAHDGEHFLVPETYQAGAVRLYRARRFPWEWSWECDLLRGERLVDPSLCRHEGRWWLFVGCGQGADTLRLLSASDLRGPWTEHPRSPIVTGDVRRARPAGRVVPWGSSVIRYAQDGAPTYGAAVRAFEITALTPRHYEEREPEGRLVLSAARRRWNGGGMHHVDPHEIAAGRWVACVDGWSERVEG